MTLGDYVSGLALLVVTVGAVVVATVIVVRRRFSFLVGAPRAVAFGVIATLTLIAVHLVPGILGILSRGSVVASAALALLIASRFPRESAVPTDEQHENQTAPSRRWDIVLAGLAVAAVVLYTLAYLRAAAIFPTTGTDALDFHLPRVARWIQSGSVWGIHQFIPNLAQGNYPNNGDLMFLAATLPWHNDAFVRFVPLPFLALAGIATYAVAIELRAPRPAAAIFAALALATPAVLEPAARDAMPDAVMIASFGGGILFLLRHARTGRLSELVLAGLGLGIAFGTKWYGVSSVIAVLAVWLVAMLLARRPVPEVFRHGLVLVATISLAGGFWLLRNVVASGNPIFPAKVQLAGLTIFDAPHDRARELGGFTIVHYLTDGHVWREYLLPAFRRTLGLSTLLPPLAVALALVGSAARRAARRGGHFLYAARTDIRPDPRLLTVAVCAFVLAAVYAITPYSAFGPEGRPVQTDANTRYLVPALLVAAPVVAAGSALLSARARLVLEIAALAAIMDALRHGLGIGLTATAEIVALVAVAAGAVLVLRRLLTHLEGGAGRMLAATCIGLTIVAVMTAGYEDQRRFNHHRYIGADRALDPVVRHARSDHRVGLAGVWSIYGIPPVWPAFGPRLGNHVTYVGPFVRGMLRRYTNCSSFAARTRRDRLDLLIVGRGFPQPRHHVFAQHCARLAGFREVTHSERLILFRASPRQKHPTPRR